jgi:hypothetical protein
VYGAKKTAELFGSEFRNQILAAKEDCVLEVPGLPNPATCDAIIRAKFCSVDWKSGMVRDYTLQQAAYAYGAMIRYFSSSWTCVCIFCDQEETTWHRFTLTEAREIVEAAIERYQHPEPPSPNEFCAWCANYNECPAIRELAGKALIVPEGALDFDAIKEDPELLGKFLAGCHALKKYEEEARATAREWLLKERPVPYFSLTKGRRSYYVPVETVLFACESAELPLDALKTVIKLAGPISKDQYEKLCAEIGRVVDPAEIKEQVGEPFVRFTGKKKPQLES